MTPDQLSLFSTRTAGLSLAEDLAAFDAFGRETAVTETVVDGSSVPTYINEFWTAKQRAAHALHEVPYRACFKPQLPRFFIERLTQEGDVVYDPFMGRGTTVIEAALRGRVPIGCDVNPLSVLLTAPRLNPPTLPDVARRLASLDLSVEAKAPDDLLVFYHPETLQEIAALRAYFLQRENAGQLDDLDRWIRMVAVTRLTGHSSGFFSVYTLPPNQAVSVESQRRINARRNQIPPRRNVVDLIMRKTRSLLRCTELDRRTLAIVRPHARLLVADAAKTPDVPSGSIDLVVTSPPFLDIVNYAQDNWLRGWFSGIEIDQVPIMVRQHVDEWEAAMTRVFRELRRVLRSGGYIAFEVGEVRSGTVRLEEAVVRCGCAVNLEAELILINDQEFTKTSNCWGVANRKKGTNTNRIVVFRKP